MPHVVDTDRLLADEIINQAQADEIARRSRETMVALAVNAILCVGIIAATFGLIFWLADAMAVAFAGAIFLALGAWVLQEGSDLYRMLGNAAALVGAGMLIGGAGIELADKFEDIADIAMLISGAVIAVGAGAVFLKGQAKLGFAAGAILLMGLALHLSGLGIAAEAVTGWAKAAVFGYSALLIAGAGLLVNVRAVTALAIVPFAQMLDTGTAYFHAAYVFYSPEATLTILQMAALIGVLCPGGDALWRPDRAARRDIGDHGGGRGQSGLPCGLALGRCGGHELFRRPGVRLFRAMEQKSVGTPSLPRGRPSRRSSSTSRSMSLRWSGRFCWGWGPIGPPMPTGAGCSTPR